MDINNIILKWDVIFFLNIPIRLWYIWLNCLTIFDTKKSFLMILAIISIHRCLKCISKMCFIHIVAKNSSGKSHTSQLFRIGIVFAGTVVSDLSVPSKHYDEVRSKTVMYKLRACIIQQCWGWYSFVNLRIIIHIWLCSVYIAKLHSNTLCLRTMLQHILAEFP